MILVILLIFFGIAIIINSFYKKTNHYKNSIENVVKFIRGAPQNLEIINLGSSYSMYGYSFEDSYLKGFNMALAPQSLMYDFKILKQYASHLSKGCIVLINIVILSFGDNEAYKNDVINRKYYYFLKKDEIENYSFLKYLKIVYFPLFSSPLSAIYIIKDVPKSNVFNIQHNQYQLKDIKKIVDSRIEGWSKDFKLSNMRDGKQVFNHIRAVRKKKTVLNDMINYCYKKNFRPVIVIPPVSEVLRSKISNEFIKSFLHQNLKNIEITVLDYWFDEEFKDEELYIHCDFMNAKGRKKFTKKVLQDLENKGYIVH